MARGVPGYSLDTEITCTEVIESSEAELAIRSLATNELGRRLDPKERLLGVKKADAKKASKKEIALGIGASEKSVSRDLTIVRHPRVLQHVLDDHLSTTAAVALVEIAVAKGRTRRVPELFRRVVLKQAGRDRRKGPPGQTGARQGLAATQDGRRGPPGTPHRTWLD